MAEENKTGMLPGIFQIVGLIACGFFTFIGLIYIFNGNLGFPSFITILALGVMMIVVHYMCVWKGKKKKNYDDLPNRMPELILGCIYLVIFLFLFLIDFHYLSIDLANKDNIKTSGKEKIANFQNMQSEYANAIAAKIQNFTASVEIAKTNYQNASAANKRTALTQLESLVGTGTVSTGKGADLNSQVDAAALDKGKSIRATYELDSLDKACEQYLKTAQTVFEDWKFLKVSYYYKDIDVFYEKYYSQAKAKMSDFNFAGTLKSEYRINDPVFSLKNSPILKLLLFFLGLVILHLCILAPYIVTKRQAGALAENKNQYSDEGSLTNYIKNKQ